MFVGKLLLLVICFASIINQLDIPYKNLAQDNSRNHPLLCLLLKYTLDHK